jgi:two-component system chemotaxis response regulator CheY
MKILVVEDDPVSLKVLETFLRRWGYEVLVAQNGRQAWDVLHKPDAASIVISDWMMPDMDGIELCAKIRRMDMAGYIYFIILTTKAGKEDVLRGLEAGADDYLTKPFDHDELKYRINIGRRIIELEQRILRMADTDPLTGILNRRAFMVRFEAEIQRSLREGIPLSLILADIDHFKRVNDQYGHQAGDQVLQAFTRQLSRSLRPYDLLGRYGGEEFIMGLPKAGSPHSGAMAERFRQGIEKTTIPLGNGEGSLHITASFGVASWRPGIDTDLDSIIRRADEALYRAKSEGRNRVSLATDP